MAWWLGWLARRLLELRFRMGPRMGLGLGRLGLGIWMGLGLAGMGLGMGLPRIHRLQPVLVGLSLVRLPGLWHQL